MNASLDAGCERLQLQMQMQMQMQTQVPLPNSPYLPSTSSSSPRHIIRWAELSWARRGGG
jgi:hypothetical protein